MEACNDYMLKERIEILREKLNDLVDQSSGFYSTRHVLDISIELDRLILQYYEQCWNCTFHSILQV